MRTSKDSYTGTCRIAAARSAYSGNLCCRKARWSCGLNCHARARVAWRSTSHSFPTSVPSAPSRCPESWTDLSLPCSVQHRARGLGPGRQGFHHRHAGGARWPLCALREIRQDPLQGKRPRAFGPSSSHDQIRRVGHETLPGTSRSHVGEV